MLRLAKLILYFGFLAEEILNFFLAIAVIDLNRNTQIIYYNFQIPCKIDLNTKVLKLDDDKHPMKFVMRYKNENR